MGEGAGGRARAQPDPARLVADADVLAADLLVGGSAREALDRWRDHEWLQLVVTDPLLDDAEAIVAALSAADLAADWRERVAADAVPVEQSPGDHPALAAAAAGRAAHLLSFDERLRSARAGVQLRERLDTSVKHPRAFARLFDPEGVREALRASPHDRGDDADGGSRRDDG